MSTSTSSGQPPAGGPAAATTGSGDGPTGDPDDSLKWFARHRQVFADPMPEKQRATWDSVQRSFRFSPRPERWREVVLTVGVLYGTFIGIPTAAGIWAAYRIWLQVRG